MSKCVCVCVCVSERENHTHACADTHTRKWIVPAHCCVQAEYFEAADVRALLEELDVASDLIAPLADEIVAQCGKDSKVHALELASAIMEREHSILGDVCTEDQPEALESRSASLAGYGTRAPKERAHVDVYTHALTHTHTHTHALTHSRTRMLCLCRPAFALALQTFQP